MRDTGGSSGTPLIFYFGRKRQASDAAGRMRARRWWGVEVEVENIGTKEVNTPAWKLRDSADGEHEEVLILGAPDRLRFTGDLTPGGKASGWVYFEIPVDVSPKWLRADPDIILKNDLYFDARPIE